MRIGDFVKITNTRGLFNDEIKRGEIGEIIAIKEFKYFTYIGIEFTRDISGHDCDGIGKEGYCSWVTKKHVKKIPGKIINK